MKPDIFDKKDFTDIRYCEIHCKGYEKHSDRCLGFVYFGDDYPRHPERKFCLRIKDAWPICPKNPKIKQAGQAAGFDV